MKSINRLMVILDPDTDSDFIVQRAKLIAKKYNANVLLFMSKPNALNPDSISSKGLSSLFFKKQQRLFAEQYEKMLQVLRGEFSAMKIRATAEFSSAKNSSDAMLKKILEYKPDITLKSIQKPSTLKNILITNTDWYLIQNSPYPLLLVKSQGWHPDGSIIAAVDPLHVKAQQNQLDHLLLDTAASLAKTLELTPRSFHSYLPDMGTMFPKVLDAGDYIKEVKRIHQEKVEELSASHGIGPENVTLVKGDLIKSLLLCIKKQKGNVLVLGALSRNFVERTIVGSTAERILYDTPCDVLIMKNPQDS
jgi:universal stress protein E